MRYKKLTVMPDFCSSGIWCKNDNYMVDFEELDLPLELISEFESWIKFYDLECTNHKDYTMYSIKVEKIEELNKRGRELAKKLKLLYPEVQVFYRGEVESAILDHKEILL